MRTKPPVLAPTLTVPGIIKAARVIRQQSQRAFASDLKVSQGMLCKYEQGVANPPARVIEHCLTIVFSGQETTVPSADRVAARVRSELKGQENAKARAALTYLLDCMTGHTQRRPVGSSR